MTDRPTTSRTDAALRHTEIGRLLAGANAAIAAKDWPAAAALLTSVLEHEPTHAEATARLTFVRAQAIHPATRPQGGVHHEVQMSRSALVALVLIVLAGSAAALALGVWAGS